MRPVIICCHYTLCKQTSCLVHSSITCAFCAVFTALCQCARACCTCARYSRQCCTADVDCSPDMAARSQAWTFAAAPQPTSLEHGRRLTLSTMSTGLCWCAVPRACAARWTAPTCMSSWTLLHPPALPFCEAFVPRAHPAPKNT